MKKLQKFIASKLWAIIPFAIFIVWYFFSLFYIFHADHSFAILSQPTSTSLRIEKNLKKAEAEINSSENNLGIVSINLGIVNYTAAKTTTFRIKKENSMKWYFQKQYDTKLISGTNIFPFGFPIIKDSKGKNYTVELEVSNGRFSDAYMLGGKNPQVFLKYKFSRQDLSSKLSLLRFVFKKVWYVTQYLNIFPVLLFIFFLSALFVIIRKIPYIIFPKFKKIKLNRFLLKKEIVAVLGIGLLLRLSLATGSYNFDITQWTQIGQVARSHINIFAYNQYYNYSPFWFIVLGTLDRVSLIISPIPFKFIVRAMLSFIDVASFFVIYGIAKQRKLPPLKTACLFFLSPVSVIISGHHGQFDNMAILSLLLAIYFAEKNKIKNKLRNRIVWCFLAASIIIKHVVIYQSLFFSLVFYKKKRVALILFGLSLFVFFLTLAPFIPESGGQILKRVFLYGGVQGLYGFTYFFGNIWGSGIYNLYKVFFLVFYLAFLFFFRPKDIIRGILLSVLFFLTFTSGIGAQYFVLPIAFGVFFPTKWFYLYTVAVTLFFLGSVDELNIYTFKVFEWNTVWLFAILWFISELVASIELLNKLYRKLATM